MASSDQVGEISLKCLQLGHPGPDGCQMVNCKIARLHAGAVVALSERNQRADLLYRKNEFPALPDKGQSPFLFLSITALAAVSARRSRPQPAHPVVTATGWVGPVSTGT